jgi:hypothetical protein
MFTFNNINDSFQFVFGLKKQRERERERKISKPRGWNEIGKLKLKHERKDKK